MDKNLLDRDILIEEKDPSEEIAEEITETLENEILEVKKQVKLRVPELIVTSAFMLVAIVLFCCQVINIWGMVIILSGALWNFFTEANRLTACIMSYIVCTLCAVYCIRVEMFGMAFLHIIFYLPTQIIYYFENSREEDVSILPNKQLKLSGLVGAVATLILIAMCLSVVLYEVGCEYYLSDSVATTLLIFSVFLSNGRYKEYWAVRISACAVAVFVWLYVAIQNGFEDNSVVFIVLFVMYMVMDSIKFINWERKQKQAKQKA